MPTFALERILPLELDAAWDHFIESGWSSFGTLPVQMKTTDKGDAETLVGNKRVICFGMQKEQILDTERPNYVEYTAFPNCFFPVKSHKGRVVFTPDSEGSTKMTWTIQYEANACGRCMARTLILCAIPLIANDLVRTAKRKSKR